MLTIRPASAEDTAALQSLYAEAITNADWLPDSARQSPRFAEVSLNEVVHVAMGDDGRLLGLISVQVADPFIHHLYVAPQARGQGVGQQLLTSLLPWLPKPWRLKCVSLNTRALAFYAKAGWREVGAGASDHGAYKVLGCD
ncbi:GNAT family N-acetyltransferase [Roseateles sp. NT4]|uniref:GNAT family N-acetyltransferase n=1 Tax=Roseateles sp. NT4 TaxID=3453715 RepID=UPI003EE98F9E